MTLAEYIALDDAQLEALLDTVSIAPQPHTGINPILPIQDREQIIAQRAAVKANIAILYPMAPVLPTWISSA